MADDTEISDLTAASALGGTEDIPGVQSAANVRITPNQLKTWASASPTLVTPALGNATGTTITLSGALTGSSDIRAGEVSYFYWLNRSQMSSPADGIVLFQNFAADGFTGQKYGGVTAAFPYLKRSGTALHVRLADDSAYAPLSAALVTVAAGTATPAAGSTAARLLFGTTAGFGIYYGSGAPTVSAAQGSLYLRSDGSGIADRLYVNTNGTTGWTAVATAS